MSKVLVVQKIPVSSMFSSARQVKIYRKRRVSQRQAARKLIAMTALQALRSGTISAPGAKTRAQSRKSQVEVDIVGALFFGLLTRLRMTKPSFSSRLLSSVCKNLSDPEIKNTVIMTCVLQFFDRNQLTNICEVFTKATMEDDRPTEKTLKSMLQFLVDNYGNFSVKAFNKTIIDSSVSVAA